MIVLVVLAIIAAIAIPFFSRTVDPAKASAMLTDVKEIRKALSLYYVEHDAEYPALVDMFNNLTQQTDIVGDPGTDFGPYLSSAPINPFSEGSLCSDDNSKDWEYDEGAGTIRAVVPPEKIAELKLAANDVIAAP